MDDDSASEGPAQIGDSLAKFLLEAEEKAKKNKTCMAIYVCQESHSVELLLDTGVSTYGDWIKGEGADICLIRCQETHKVYGVRLPLYNERLLVQYDGPIRVNAPFRKDEEE